MGRYDERRKTLYWTAELQQEVDALAGEMRKMGLVVDRGDKQLVGVVLLYALQQANRLVGQKEEPK